MKIPDNHQRLMPYLILPNAEGFSQFMQKVFGAKETYRTGREGEGGIMHGELQIGEATVMFADSTDVYSPTPAGMYIYVEDVDATYKAGLAEGATSAMEPSQRNYGYAGGIRDPFGNTWWLTQPGSSQTD